MTSERVIGKDGNLPWHLPEDLRFFKETTTGHPILMGRKTYESIGKPLPNRRNLVLTRSETFQAPGCEILNSVEDLADLVLDDPTVWVIGGAGVYTALLPDLDELLVTHVFQNFQGDTFFPEFGEFFEPVEKIRETGEFKIVRYRRKSLA